MEVNTTNNPINNPAPYAQPAIVQGAIAPVVIVNNQEKAEPPNFVNPNRFKSNEIFITCPFCRKPMTTKVKLSINICACLLCYFTGIIFYVCVQCFREKDLCCFDAEHTCTECGNVVGTYTPC